MEVVYPRCCGLDIHSKDLYACRIIPGPDGAPVKEIRRFGTMTCDLLSLAEWLSEGQVSHVAMESTGVFWKPVYNLLEGTFTLLLANARNIKAVPGRKTDVRDCEWIADLLRHGLVPNSFVPERPQRELRELTRYRTTLVRERAAEFNRLEKTLEGANIKLGQVASTMTGKSVRLMLLSLVEGRATPEQMAALAKGRLKEKLPQLQQALTGVMGAHQRFLLSQQLLHLEQLEELIEAVSREIEERLRPFTEALTRLQEIPGVGQRTAEVLVAEIGTDMSRFRTEKHLCSWAAMCPGNNASAGKQGSGRTREGNPWLRSTLVEAAQAASRCKGSYLSAQYHRLAARIGKRRAAMAVGHSLLVIIYHLLSEGGRYQDLGANYLDERNKEATIKRSVRRLEELGFKVNLEQLPQAA